MATTAEIAQAVVESVNTTVFSRPVTAVRAWLPVYDLGAMDALRVTVVPTTRSVALEHRSALRVDHRIEVAVQQRADPADLATIDALVALCGEITDHLSGASLPGLTDVRWTTTEHVLLAAPEHLNELRQFTGIVATTWRSWEER